jgi:L-asparaginase
MGQRQSSERRRLARRAGGGSAGGIGGRLALAAALLAGTGGGARGQHPTPAVHIVATGGTIASTADDTLLTGESLVRAVPALRGVADIRVEQFVNVGSSQITPAHWLGLAQRIGALFAQDSGLAGIVVTHGTDTMEETAYFLDLTVSDPRPVVVTGSMRPADAVGADGPANLLNAVRVAAAQTSRGRGTLVLMNDEVFAARDVTKAHTSRLDAFRAMGAAYSA